MRAKDLKLTLEDFEVLTNKEVLSTWSKFASFIRIYDNIEWEDAKIKALELLEEKKAESYLERFREKQLSKKANPEESKSDDSEKLKDLKQKNYKRSVKVDLLSIYEKNYLKLLKLCPNLEDYLKNYKNGDSYYSLSTSSGFMDFVCEILEKDQSGYYLSIGHYYVINGDIISDPDMEILVKPDDKTCYALNITQSMFGFTEVYDNKYKRKLINTKEQTSQNKFLGTWFKNLIEQDHNIEFLINQKVNEPFIEQSTGELKHNESILEKSIVIEPIIPKETQNTIHKNVDSKATNKKGENKSNYQDESFLANKRYKKFISQINYYLFLKLVPNFEKYTHNIEPTYFHDSFFYKVSITKDKVSDILIINDNINENQSEYGLTIELAHKKKELHLVESRSKIKGLIDYSNKPDYKNDFSIEDFNAHKALYNFLNKLNEIKCEENKKVESKEEIKETTNEVETKDIETTKDLALIEKNSDDSLDFDEAGKVRDIPIFEVGNVQLTDKHKKAGLTQKDIDFINKNRTGIVLRPAKNMVNNTKDFENDASKNAKKPGYRVSRTGQIYYESRSNRSDLTPFGL